MIQCICTSIETEIIMQIQKLYPECKDYLRGGNKLKEIYGKETEKSP